MCFEVSKCLSQYWLLKVHCYVCVIYASCFTEHAALSLKILCCYLSGNGRAGKALPDTVILNFYLLIFLSGVSTDSFLNSGLSLRGTFGLKCKDQ